VSSAPDNPRYVNLADPRRIYVASSWRNTFYPEVVDALNAIGHLVYDFRNPAPDNAGFAWSDIDPEWLGWTPDAYRDLLDHPVAQSGFKLDMDALNWCDTLVLVLPCGRSAHLELGYAVGKGKDTWVLLREDGFEPELMYAMVGQLVCSLDELSEGLTRE
jgi:hypothetical protein